MEVTTERFIRKPLYVDAVRVTSQNFEAVAAWCDGEILKETEGPRAGKSYIRVRVQYPKSPRQTKAFISDWVLYTDTGYKVYTNPSFRKSFDPAPTKEERRPATAEEIREKLPQAQDRRPTAPPQNEEHTLPVQAVEPGADLEETPQGEEIEVVEATPQAIADAVNEQQPVEEPVHLETKPYEETIRAQEEREEQAVVDSPDESTPLVPPHTPITPAEPVAEEVSVDDEDVRQEMTGQAQAEVEQTMTTAPEVATEGKMVISLAEQRQLGPDGVRELLSSGEAVLEQDLAESA